MTDCETDEYLKDCNCMKGPANNLVIMHDDILDAQQTASINSINKK